MKTHPFGSSFLLAIGISHPPAFRPVPRKALRVSRYPLPDKPVASGPHPALPSLPEARGDARESLPQVCSASIACRDTGNFSLPSHPPFLPTHIALFFSNKLSLQDIWEAVQLPMPCAREGSQPRAHREEEKEEEEGSSAALHAHPAAPKSTTPNLLPV